MPPSAPRCSHAGARAACFGASPTSITSPRLIPIRKRIDLGKHRLKNIAQPIRIFPYRYRFRGAAGTRAVALRPARFGDRRRSPQRRTQCELRYFVGGLGGVLAFSGNAGCDRTSSSSDRMPLSIAAHRRENNNSRGRDVESISHSCSVPKYMPYRHGADLVKSIEALREAELPS
jgi:hypothetical protein